STVQAMILKNQNAGSLALRFYHAASFFEILRSQRRVFSGGYIAAAIAQGFSVSAPFSPHDFPYSLFSGTPH
ncbi:hypothetical protein ACLBP3_30470, partial [Klebsiella pneumoniae]